MYACEVLLLTVRFCLLMRVQEKSECKTQSNDKLQFCMVTNSRQKDRLRAMGHQQSED